LHKLVYPDSQQLKPKVNIQPLKQKLRILGGAKTGLRKYKGRELKEISIPYLVFLPLKQKLRISGGAKTGLGN
jgi:hypothetical protein